LVRVGQGIEDGGARRTDPGLVRVVSDRIGRGIVLADRDGERAGTGYAGVEFQIDAVEDVAGRRRAGAEGLGVRPGVPHLLAHSRFLADVGDQGGDGPGSSPGRRDGEREGGRNEGRDDTGPDAEPAPDSGGPCRAAAMTSVTQIVYLRSPVVVCTELHAIQRDGERLIIVAKSCPSIARNWRFRYSYSACYDKLFAYFSQYKNQEVQAALLTHLRCEDSDLANMGVSRCIGLFQDVEEAQPSRGMAE